MTLPKEGARLRASCASCVRGTCILLFSLCIALRCLDSRSGSEFYENLLEIDHFLIGSAFYMILYDFFFSLFEERVILAGAKCLPFII